ncbi:Maf family protein [Nitrococcus mobilis]|uniref:dTTP/UTP pyrophosphatase n=1 Tax=Nitrococcus mobilis Nb-231 TaxID=314278 RepID=A4BQN3_9GAMM|nr:Maf-like protein [Nitrococcus mobilis Nb-231]
MESQALPDIYLASASPRRRQLLKQLGVHFAEVQQDIEETPQPRESPEVFVLRLALEKARAGLQALPEDQLRPVLGADTVVVIDDEVLGKPADEAQAMAMLRRLSGQVHRVLTGVALVTPDHEATRLSVSNVTFRPLQAEELHAYWRSGEPCDKAGGYAIQGRGGGFVAHLDGSYSGVMGLPLFEVGDLLAEFEIAYQRHWGSG